MAITDSVRKALTEPAYAVAGTVDLAGEKLREVPPLLEKLREEAPERINEGVNKVRATDPKVVQERVAHQAKEVQAKLVEIIGSTQPDLKKLTDSAQEFALQQLGRAAEVAVRAGETYGDLVERGRGAVRTWRGEAAEEVEELAVAIEPEPERKPEAEARPGTPAPRKPVAKKTAARKAAPGKSAE